MAAAEARTAWQRMANRCFVQEDAKRAPKFACCPSSVSKLQSDSGNEDATHEKDHTPLNFAHVNWNPANLNFPPDTKWWLQVQPNIGYQELSREQLHAFEGKSEDKSEAKTPPALKSDANIGPDADKKGGILLEPPQMMSTKLVRHNSETKIEGLKAATSIPEFLKHKLNLQERWHDADELMSWKAADQLISVNKENTCFDLASTWVSGEKTEPWWKIADREELASFVAKKSLEYFDNCDLPPPQKMHICGGALPCFENVEDDGGLPSYLNARMCIPSKHSLHSSSGSLDSRNPSLSQIEHPFPDSSVLLSDDHIRAVNINDKKERVCPSDPSKAELLEALCHSQTRARKAEIAAQKAYDEKEHVIKLFFRQASHLFAYRQWLQLLQLERLFLQLKFRDEDLTTQAADLPWAASDDRFRECKDKEKKAKENHSCGICGLLVAFAVGFSLASAGLLLGWTLGCLLPV